jgi:thymidine phosphorylase
MALALASSLVKVANGAGLPTRACISDMNQVLGHACGNAVEVSEALAFLSGQQREPRLLELTRLLSAELLQLGRLSSSPSEALRQVDVALDSGAALEHFARMVAALGGPSDFVQRASHYLPSAPVQLAVTAPHSGWISAMATRDIGLLVIELGGGRRQASDRVDARVGFTHFAALGQQVQTGERLATVHAADLAAAQMASSRLQSLISISEQAPGPLQPVLLQRLLEA